MSKEPNFTNITADQFCIPLSSTLQFKPDAKTTVFYIIKNGRVHITRIKGPRSRKTVSMQIEYIELLEESIGYDDLQINTSLPTDGKI
jgi:hypothetical protein